MRCRTAQFCVVLLAVAALDAARAADPTPHIWILPFDNPGADDSLEYLREAFPALLAVAISQSDEHAVVDRRHWNQVLAEQSLTLEGLTSDDTRHRVGRLLGATVMISGGFVRQGRDVLVSVRASDVETGIVVATAEARGPADQPDQWVGGLYRGLARDLGRRLPALNADHIDEAPQSNLHFMRGLGYYHSARYSQALAEFMQASDEKRLTEISQLWMANAYLAQQQFGHAYLELARLTRGDLAHVRRSEIQARMGACERHLGPDELKIILELAVPEPQSEE